MTEARRARGQPLLALVLLMVAWIGLRAVFWNSSVVPVPKAPELATLRAGAGPVPGGEGPATDIVGQLPAGPQSFSGEEVFALQAEPEGSFAPWTQYPPTGAPGETRFRQPLPARRSISPREYSPGAFGWGLIGPLDAPQYAPSAVPAEAPEKHPVPVRVAIAHQMLWMAAISRMPLPMALLSGGGGAAASLFPSGGGANSVKRWSADAWLLLRKGGNVSLANGVVPATYGASQMGAVLRYRLAPNSGHRPSAYLRTTAALNGSREKEAAFGLSARPVSSLPLAVAAEVRATDQPGSRQVRPAVLAWTELAPFKLPMNTRGEFYAQGGYVGGKFNTPFADGQLRVDHGVASFGRAELRAGAGAWAGAQKGASRVDVGPTANMGLPISNSASARVAVDWRFRVTGNAEPKSGPAFTLSAGF